MQRFWLILAVLLSLVPTLGATGLERGAGRTVVRAADCCCETPTCGASGGGAGAVSEADCGCTVSGSVPGKLPADLPPAAMRVVLDCFVLPLVGLELQPAVGVRAAEIEPMVSWGGVGRSCLCVWQK